MVTENGIWIKDEINQTILIINAKKIKNNYLNDVLISEFNEQFNLIRIIKSKEIDISNKKWQIISPSIIVNNVTTNSDNNVKLDTHFNMKKINELFSDLSSLNILALIKLREDYKLLGYSTTEIDSHLNRIYALPFYLSVMTVIAAIMMLNIKRNKPMIFYMILSIFLSVIIYYIYYLFNLMGESGKIPLHLSTWLPLILLTIFIIIGLVRINEK
jgi:lipopolysaccharide export system permease protein